MLENRAFLLDEVLIMEFIKEIRTEVPKRRNMGISTFVKPSDRILELYDKMVRKSLLNTFNDIYVTIYGWDDLNTERIIMGDIDYFIRGYHTYRHG
jgi:hypothetical protein